MDFIRSKYSQSVWFSLKAKEVIVAEVNESMLIKFNTEMEMKAYVASLKF